MSTLKLVVIALLGLVSPPHRDHIEIYVVSCTVRWFDVEHIEQTTTLPVWAYRSEHQANEDARIRNAPHDPWVFGCDVAHVLLGT